MLRQQGGDDAVSVVLPWASSPLAGACRRSFNQTLVEVCRVSELPICAPGRSVRRAGWYRVGCALAQWDAPVVEYRAWCDGVVAGHGTEGGFVRPWETSPISLYVDAFAVTGCDTC